MHKKCEALAFFFSIFHNFVDSGDSDDFSDWWKEQFTFKKHFFVYYDVCFFMRKYGVVDKKWI